MILATLYKITNKINGMFYWGIVYGKNKTINHRFDDHMRGKGGRFLYKHGVLQFGAENFQIEAIKTDSLDSIREIEVTLNKTNLWPIGYNGNTSHAIVLTQSQQEQISKTKQKKFKDHPETKPIPPNWKGRTRSNTMRKRLSDSKMGHLVDIATREKIGKTWSARAIADPNTCNRKTCLLIDPVGHGHYSIMGKKKLLKKLGLPEMKQQVYNTGIAFSSCNTTKSRGWYFYDDILLIEKLLIKISVRTYE